MFHQQRLVLAEVPGKYSGYEIRLGIITWRWSRDSSKWAPQMHGSIPESSRGVTSLFNGLFLCCLLGGYTYNVFFNQLLFKDKFRPRMFQVVETLETLPWEAKLSRFFNFNIRFGAFRKCWTFMLKILKFRSEVEGAPQEQGITKTTFINMVLCW